MKKGGFLKSTLTAWIIVLFLSGCTAAEQAVNNTEENTVPAAGLNTAVPTAGDTTGPSHDDSPRESRSEMDGIWSPDKKWMARTTVARIWIDTDILNVESNKEYKTNIFQFIVENAQKYDFKIGENQRPDPYINYVDWSPDSNKILLSYSFTDDYYTRQTGAAVYNLEKSAVDWLVKLTPVEGEHADIGKPEGFNWESTGYGMESGLTSVDTVNGEGVYNRENFRKAVNGFADAVNKGDIGRLRAFTDPERPERFTEESLRTAIEYYSLYFRGQGITRQEFAGIYSFGHQMAVYRLFNGDGRYKDVYFNYDENKGYQCIDGFLYYSGYAAKIMGYFLEALVKEDAVGLKSVLTEDDLEYPSEKVPEIINKYRAEFDLKSLAFKFTGNVAENGSFIYTLTGKKEGMEKEHELEVAFGDGLVAIRDPWIPGR